MMIPFAVTLPPAARTDLLALVEMLFWLYVPISFICVTGYAAKQYREGQLINGHHAPLPFQVQGMSGWLFVVCTLGLIFLQSALYLVVVFFGIFGLLMENGRTATEQFGFKSLKPVKVLSWSLLTFGAVMLVETPLTQAVMWILDSIHLPHPEQETVETFRQSTKTSTILWFMFQAVLLFPIVEELFFRGFLLTFLKNYTTTWVALILSAGVFAFAHVNLGAVLPLWFLGVVLGLAYEHTGSLLLPMGIHACWNLITALSLLLDKGNS